MATENVVVEALIDPRLRSLDPLVGVWDLHHRDLATGEMWGGRDEFEWLDGGFFLRLSHEETRGISGTMIIGFEKRWGEERFTDEIVGHWFENSGSHYIYYWEVDGRTVRFAFEEPGSDYRFLGQFSEDKYRIEGEWHLPGGGAYALIMTRHVDH
jgi:hypothetical protein